MKKQSLLPAVRIAKAKADAIHVGYFTTGTLAACLGVSLRQMQIYSESTELQKELRMYKSPGRHRHFDIEKCLGWLDKKDKVQKGTRFSIAIVDGFWLGEYQEESEGYKNQWKNEPLMGALENVFYTVDIRHYSTVIEMLMDYSLQQFRFIIVPSRCPDLKIGVGLLLKGLKLESSHLRGVFIEHPPGEERQYSIRTNACFGSTFADRLVTINAMRIEQEKLVQKGL
jgi:hypothetical protein